MGRPLRALRRSLQLPAARAVALFAALLPRRGIGSLSRAVGWLLAGLPLSSNRVIESNSRAAREAGGLTSSVETAEVYASVLAGLLDFLHLSRCSDAEFRRIVLVEGAENMSRALSAGRGALAITAHYSAWELIPRAVGLLGHRVGVISRKLSEPRTSEWLDSLRSRPGVETVDRGSGGRRLLELLRDNFAIGVLIDQDTKGAESDFVTFFGRPARTPVGTARLSVRLGIPTLTLHIRRLGDREGRYLLQIDEPVDTSDLPDVDPHLELTQRLTSRMEDWVREDPNQWIWFHRRWARQPG